MTGRPNAAYTEDRPPIRLTYQRPPYVGEEGVHTVEFTYAKVLIRYLRTLGSVMVMRVEEVVPEPPRWPYRATPTRRQMQERLGVTGNEDV